MCDHGGQSLFGVGSESRGGGGRGGDVTSCPRVSCFLFSPLSLGFGRQKKVGGENEDELRQEGASD